MRLLLGLVLFCVIAVIAALSYIKLSLTDAELRQVFIEQVEGQTGYRIGLSGTVEFSLIPDFGLVAETVSVEDAEGSLSVTVGRVVAKVEWLPLFSGRVRIKGIELTGPRIVLSDRPEPVNGEDAGNFENPIQAAASLIDKLNIDHLEIIEGHIGRRSADAITWLGEDINLRAAIPGSSDPVWVSLEGIWDGRSIAMEAEIGALSEMLNGKATAFELSASAQPALYPGAGNVSIGGMVQLDDAGTYTITDGELSVEDHRLAVAGSFSLGDRPRVTARLTGSDFDFLGQVPSPLDSASEQKAGSAVDLTSLLGFDAEIGFSVERFSFNGIAAGKIDASLVLNDGEIDLGLSASRFAGGRIETQIASDLNKSLPTFTGGLNTSSVDIQAISKFAPTPFPASGLFDADLQFAFLGTELELARQSLNMAGSVKVMQGSLEVPALETDFGENAGQFENINLAIAIENLERPVDLSGNLRWQGEPISLSSRIDPEKLFIDRSIPLELALTSRLFEGHFDGQVTDGGDVRGASEFKTKSLPGFLTWIGYPVDGLPATFSYEGDLSLDAERKNVSLSAMQVRADDLSANGRVSVDLKGKPAVTASLAFDDLDTTPFMGSDESGQSRPSSSEMPIDLAFLKSIDADVAFSAKRILHEGLVTGAASGTMRVTDGRAQAKLDPTPLYGGSLEAIVFADGASAVPGLDLAMSVKGADGLELLKQLAGFDRVEGTLDLDLNLAGAGTTSRMLTKSLGGKVDLKFTDGALKGISVAKVLRDLRTVTTYGFEGDAGDRTEFTELTLGLDMDGGIATTRDLRMIGPLIRMDGAGTIDLNTEQLDLALNPKLVGSLTGQGGTYDLSGIEVPIRVSGSFDNPRIYPDVRKLLANPGKAIEVFSRLEDGLKGLGANGGRISEVLSDNLKKVKPDTDDLIGQALQGISQGALNPGQGVLDGNALTDRENVVGAIARQAIGDRISVEGLLGAASKLQGSGRADEQGAVPLPTPSPISESGAMVSPSAVPEAKSLEQQIVDEALSRIAQEESVVPERDLLKGILNSLQQ